MITIMVIDNSAQLEQSLRRLLTEAHIDAQIHCAADSKEALRFLESGGKPEIIFSDIDQPTSGGIDLFKRMQPDYPAIKRVVVTDSQCFEMAKYVINLQLNGYLSKPLDPEETESLLRQLLPEELLSWKDPFREGRYERDEQAKRRVIREVLAIVERDVERDIGLDYIAQKVHISSCYLSALFREATGQGLISYITDYRMKLASELLRKTNLRIFEVAQRTGYRSTPYFCTVFKGKYGITPSEFRDQGFGAQAEAGKDANTANI